MDVRKQCSTRDAAAKRGPVSGRAAGAGSGRGGDENPSRDRDITKYARVARKLLQEAWPEIVAALVAKAKNGRYQEIRLLLELCDLARVDRNQVKEERQRQLCDALMDGLGLRPAAETAFKPEDGLNGPAVSDTFL